MHASSTSPRIGFGPFEFDPAGGELYRDGQRVRLQEQPRQVLVALLARPGEIVTREELRDRLWNADTFVDFEHGLNTAVKKVRQALDDSAEAPRFVETVARRGYRFIGAIDTPPAPVPVVPAGAAGAAPAPEAPAPSTSPTPSARLKAGVLVGVAAIAVGAATLMTWLAVRDTPRAPAQLAVMPLRVLSDSAQDAYVGIGIADAITTRLAGTRQIAVRPTSAVIPYKDAQADPAEVAASLGVQHLLLGTIHVAEGSYRIRVQLVGADGVAVWGRTFDEPRAGLLAVQDRIAEQVASALRIEMSAPERARLHVHHTTNPAAHDMYLRGRSLLVNYTEANMRDAIGYFERALALDPDYALARAGVATASAWFSVRYAYETEALAWGKRADQEARRALEQDGSLADAHFAIASAAGTLYGGFEWKVVLDRSAAALALDQSLDLAHLERMRAFYHLGLFEEAREEGRLARAVNPGSNVATERLDVAAQLFGGEFESAATQAAALLQRTDAPAARHYLGLARYYAGDARGAREMLESARRGGRPDARSQASLASIEAAIGMPAEAKARIAAILRESYMDHHVAYSLGAAFAQLRDSDTSLTWLERAADTGFPCQPWFERDTLLDPLRRDPRFVRLLDRLRQIRADVRRRSP